MSENYLWRTIAALEYNALLRCFRGNQRGFLSGRIDELAIRRLAQRGFLIEPNASLKPRGELRARGYTVATQLKNRKALLSVR